MKAAQLFSMQAHLMEWNGLDWRWGRREAGGVVYLQLLLSVGGKIKLGARTKTLKKAASFN